MDVCFPVFEVELRVLSTPSTVGCASWICGRRRGDRGDRGDRGGQRRLHPPNSTVMIRGLSSHTSEHSIGMLLRDYGDVQVSLAHVAG